MTIDLLRRAASVVISAAALASCADVTDDAPRRAPVAASPRAAANDPADEILLRAGSSTVSVREKALIDAEASADRSRAAALRALASDDAALARGAANVLARTADASCVPTLVRALHRAGDASAPALLQSLGRTGTAEAGVALVGEIVGANERRAFAAAAALEGFAGTLDLSRLRAATRPGNAPSSRQAALAALGAHAQAADRPIFLEASFDASCPIRAAAARGLIGCVAAREEDVRRLVLLDASESVRTAAARAAAYAPLAVVLAPLEEALYAFKEDDTVPAAIRSLAAHKDPAAFEALLAFVKDDTQTVDLRIVAARGLASIDPEKTAEFLKREAAVFDTELRAECDQILAFAERR